MSDVPQLDAPVAQAMVRAIETAASVRRRYQFFVWSQAHLNALLPHRLAVCGAWQRQRRALVFEVFQSVVLAEPVLQAFSAPDSPLMLLLAEQWVERQCQPLRIAVAGLAMGSLAEPCAHLLEAGIAELMVHGVSRPQRQVEVESLFLFGAPGMTVGAQQLDLLGLVMPHLHSTYLRVNAVERDLRSVAAPIAPRSAGGKPVVSARERQILALVREGMSNLQIAEQLGISALTVKNHVQKILRKLGATNRAQAVSRAIALNLISSQEQPA